MHETIIVTSGPAIAHIDSTRRITNFSTGQLGAALCDSLVRNGFHVKSLCSRSAVVRPSLCDIEWYSTNDDLQAALKDFASAPWNVRAVFHAAALCDYYVSEVEAETGGRLSAHKIESRDGPIVVKLSPAPKILPLLKNWFPNAEIIGWKYEMDGDRTSILRKAARQFEEARTSICIVNGQSYGMGFGVYRSSGELTDCPDLESLIIELLKIARSVMS
jgi:phosphopantothenoylcysteine synthetase/decarboxylase